MLTKTFGRILIALSLVFLSACTKAPEEKAGERLMITVQAESPATKTVLSDDGQVTRLAFTAGDRLGFFANGILSNIPLDYVDDGSGTFCGQAWVDSEQAEYRAAVDYYAYYPFSKEAGKDPTALKGVLPSKQIAPFDPLADYLVADPVTDDYFVENFPVLNFEFSTHLFAIVKLSVTNSNPDYANEQIFSIGLKSTERPLAGQFTFSAEDGSMAFTDDPNYLSYTLDVAYEDAPTLGIDTEHSVYAVVYPASYASGTLSLEVRTTSYIFTIPSTKVFRPRTNQMTALSTADLATADNPSPSARTLVLWGASTISSALVKQIQLQLGPKWKVIGCGSSGDTSYGIAARQGGLSVYTQSTAFTLPASSEEYADINGLYWLYDNGVKNQYGLADHLQYFNPLLIDGIECEISGSKTAGFKLRRLTDGDPVEISARSEVSTNASRAYADADVIVTNLGLNGRSKTSDEQLIVLNERMKAHLTKPDAVMIVWGFSQSMYDFPQYWSKDYVDLFTDHFGKYFMEQRGLGGGENAVKLMLEIGQITDESQISETDWEYINRGDWPFSWFRGAGDVHVNSRGQQVYAILLRRRMAELGLL